MNANYFSGYYSSCYTVEETKRLYRTLAFENHPDLGGSTEIMQAINDQYHDKLRELDGQQEKASYDPKKTWTYRYDEQTEQATMDKIAEFLALKLEGVELLLIGTWLWVQGKTRESKDAIKGLGFKYNGKRKMWYFNPNPEKKTRYNSRANLGDLAKKYGSRIVKHDEKGMVVA